MFRYGVAVLVVSAAMSAGGAVVATPALADGDVVACHWVNREYFQTYTCEEPVAVVESLDIADCWKFPVSDRSFVRLKTDEGWVRSSEITVSVREGSRKCEDEAYPHRTVVTIPGALLEEMVPTRVQLVMPRTSVTQRHTVSYAACLMPDEAVDWCPRR